MEMTTPKVAAAPVVARPIRMTNQECIAKVVAGDWWYKWTKSGTKAEPVFCWLDTKTHSFCWGRSPNASWINCDGFRLRDVMDVTADNVIEQRGYFTVKTEKVWYVMRVKVHERTDEVIIGTEQREKFKVWYQCMTSLTERVRVYNAHMA